MPPGQCRGDVNGGVAKILRCQGDSTWGRRKPTDGHLSGTGAVPHWTGEPRKVARRRAVEESGATARGRWRLSFTDGHLRGMPVVRGRADTRARPFQMSHLWLARLLLRLRSERVRRLDGPGDGQDHVLASRASDHLHSDGQAGVGSGGEASTGNRRDRQG